MVTKKIFLVLGRHFCWVTGLDELQDQELLLQVAQSTKAAFHETSTYKWPKPIFLLSQDLLNTHSDWQHNHRFKSTDTGEKIILHPLPKVMAQQRGLQNLPINYYHMFVSSLKKQL